MYRANKDVHLSLPTRKLAPPAIPLYLSIRLIFLNRVHTPFDPSPSSLHYSTISQIFRAIDRLIRNPRKSRASPARAAACKSGQERIAWLWFRPRVTARGSESSKSAGSPFGGETRSKSSVQEQLMTVVIVNRAGSTRRG